MNSKENQTAQPERAMYPMSLLPDHMLMAQTTKILYLGTKTVHLLM